MSSCPSRDSIQGLLDECLEGMELEEIVIHIEICANCQELLEALTRDALAEVSRRPAGVGRIRRAVPADDPRLALEVAATGVGRRRCGPGGADQARGGDSQVPVRSCASFRAWLKTVTQHALSDFFASHRKDPNRTAAPIDMIAESVEAKSDLEQRLEDAFDAEVLELAMHRVKQRVKAGTWDAFHLTAVEGLTGALAATRLQIPVAHVFVAKNRVQKMLQEEARSLKKKLK